MAIVLMKYDKNLAEVREDMVPDSMSEEDFWRNYFYAVESLRKDHGLPSSIGDKLGESTRLNYVNDELEELKTKQASNQPPKGADKAEVELQSMKKEENELLN